MVLAKRVVAIGAGCRNLRRYIHISTAYVNPFGEEMAGCELVALPAGIDIKALPLAAEDAARAYSSSPGHHVNTYTWSKVIGEHCVSDFAQAHGMPLAIVRPSVSLADPPILM